MVRTIENGYLHIHHFVSGKYTALHCFDDAFFHCRNKAPRYHTADNWPAWYWGYWVSGDLGESWEYSWVGAGDRVLFDGDTDGWLALPGDDYTSVPVTPLVPVAFVGDVNGDGKVTFADIDPFVLALSGESAYDRVFSHGRYLNADCNGDGKITFADIDPFVARLGQSSTK